MNSPCVAIGASLQRDDLQPDDRPFSRESKIASKKNPTNPITVDSSSPVHQRHTLKWCSPRGSLCHRPTLSRDEATGDASFFCCPDQTAPEPTDLSPFFLTCPMTCPHIFGPTPNFAIS